MADEAVKQFGVGSRTEAIHLALQEMMALRRFKGFMKKNAGSRTVTPVSLLELDVAPLFKLSRLSVDAINHDLSIAQAQKKTRAPNWNQRG